MYEKQSGKIYFFKMHQNALSKKIDLEVSTATRVNINDNVNVINQYYSLQLHAWW